MKIEITLTEAAVAAITRFIAMTHPASAAGEEIDCVECLVGDWVNKNLRAVLPFYDGAERPNADQAARMAREGAAVASEKWDAANLAKAECPKAQDKAEAKAEKAKP